MTDDEQTEKMPSGEELCGYCENGAVKPVKSAHQTCPKCHENFMHEPAINIDIRERNAESKKTWVAKNKEFMLYEKSLNTRNPLPRPMDDKGRPMMKVLPPPKWEAEFLICTAHTRTHCFAYKGFKCSNCIDRTCSTCQNKCRFVCTKE